SHAPASMYVVIGICKFDAIIVVEVKIVRCSTYRMSFSLFEGVMCSGRAGFVYTLAVVSIVARHQLIGAFTILFKRRFDVLHVRYGASGENCERVLLWAPLSQGASRMHVITCHDLDNLFDSKSLIIGILGKAATEPEKDHFLVGNLEAIY